MYIYTHQKLTEGSMDIKVWIWMGKWCWQCRWWKSEIGDNEVNLDIHKQLLMQAEPREREGEHRLSDCWRLGLCDFNRKKLGGIIAKGKTIEVEVMRSGCGQSLEGELKESQWGPDRESEGQTVSDSLTARHYIIIVTCQHRAVHAHGSCYPDVEYDRFG